MEIAKFYPGINVIISSDPKINNLSPSLVGKTLITQTKTMGQYLGVLDITLSPKITWKSNYFALNNLERKKQINAHKIKSMQKQGGSQAELGLLQEEQAGIPAQMKKLQQRLKQQKGSSYQVEFVPVSEMLFEDSVVKAIID
ncbi:hypothetical protein [Desulfotalea psychrophila]|uniref:Uncharacterized protein n=1 Tax=Desulfotalea psychrophila (strain LSv54 / DSM 12343) TaxID=177439 RepID=Q6AL67_DESPS|nr:hypothetical protein [Desulfotalea psychrophila]CAG36908.1 unknown protein [Desulfotalea psychrophila LSv54]